VHIQQSLEEYEKFVSDEVDKQTSEQEGGEGEAAVEEMDAREDN
jgi:hypothetical protein